MTHAEMEAFAKELGPQIRDFVAHALMPIAKRVIALEQARATDRAELAAAISRTWANDNGPKK
jgi:hypothetical protein